MNDDNDGNDNGGSIVNGNDDNKAMTMMTTEEVS